MTGVPCGHGDFLPNGRAQQRDGLARQVGQRLIDEGHALRPRLQDGFAGGQGAQVILFLGLQPPVAFGEQRERHPGLFSQRFEQ